jgi:hypothetical protein
METGVVIETEVNFIFPSAINDFPSAINKSSMPILFADDLV